MMVSMERGQTPKGGRKEHTFTGVHAYARPYIMKSFGKANAQKYATVLADTLSRTLMNTLSHRHTLVPAHTLTRANNSCGLCAYCAILCSIL